MKKMRTLPLAPRPMTRSSKNGRPKRSEPQNGGVGSGLSFDVARAVTTEKGNCEIEFPNLGECIESLISLFAYNFASIKPSTIGSCYCVMPIGFELRGASVSVRCGRFHFQHGSPNSKHNSAQNMLHKFQGTSFVFSIFDSPQSSGDVVLYHLIASLIVRN